MATKSSLWNFNDYEYKVKPETRVFWKAEYLNNNPLGKGEVLLSYSTYNTQQECELNWKLAPSFLRVVKFVEEL